jgi:hypothetical protein
MLQYAESDAGSVAESAAPFNLSEWETEYKEVKGDFAKTMYFL